MANATQGQENKPLQETLQPAATDLTPGPFENPAGALDRKAIDDLQILSGAYWGELRTFLAVAKAKSLTRAADTLGSSHATVGREIRRLQDQLGAQLIVLTKNGAQLTQRGVALAKALLTFDHQLASLARDLNSETSQAEGTVSLGITDGLGLMFLAPVIEAFSRKYPKIQIHIKSPGNFRDIRENLTDIMLGFVPDQSSAVTCKPLGWLHFIPFVTHGYVNSYGMPTRDNLKDHVFIDSVLYASRPGPWGSWQGCVAQGRVLHYCDTSLTYGMLVKAGVGIGLLGSFNVMEPSAVMPDLGVHAAVRLYAVALTERLNSRPVRIVMELIEEIFGTGNPWFQERLVTQVNDYRYRAGYEMLFNLK